MNENEKRALEAGWEPTHVLARIARGQAETVRVALAEDGRAQTALDFLQKTRREDWPFRRIEGTWTFRGEPLPRNEEQFSSAALELEPAPAGDAEQARRLADAERALKDQGALVDELKTRLAMAEDRATAAESDLLVALRAKLVVPPAP